MKHRILLVCAEAKAPAALRLAGDELAKHLSAACRGESFGRTRLLDRAHFILGTFDELSAAGLDLDGRNDRWVDEIVVRSDTAQLILAGSNPRSVLFAVYTYLDALGFAWTMPGPEGEVVPTLERVPLDGYDIRHRASLIYRGFALAGAFDAARGAAFVQWMARNRFNHLFLEGETRRASYSQAMDRTVSPSEARRYDRRLAEAAQRRGLILEKVGHGWTARSIGVDPNGSGRPDLPDSIRPMVAERGGVRDPGESRGNIQLCLSNPESNRRMTEEVCRYADEHREMDILAVWMGDGFNNWCECAQCARVHPSDLWVRLVNRIARAVHDVRPELRIEALSYSALMEPPPTERIDNSRGNVVLMYAPFLRCYLHALDDPACVSDKPLQRFPPANRLHHPMNAEFFCFFKTWREGFEGTNYVFDYYNWLPVKRDVFEGEVARTIARDMKSYPSHGITGCVDCSRAQSFWPTPLARWMLSRTAWDASADPPAERRRLLELCFGEHAGAVDRYLTLLYDCLLPEQHGRAEERALSPRNVRGFKGSLPRARRALVKAIESSRGARRKLLRRVAVHAQFTLLQLDGLLAEADGKYDRAMDLNEKMHALAHKHGRLLDGAADPPEIDWLRRDNLKRLTAKKQGAWRRID